MDTTNLQTGVSGKTMLLDFADEVQVKSSGYNAEFGGATGGVVNVLTKSGSQLLPRSARHLLSRSDGFLRRPPARSRGSIRSIHEPRRKPDCVESGQQMDILTARSADIGGPIFRDRLWFYGGRRLHEERVLERRHLPDGREQDEASFRSLDRREVLQLQHHQCADQQHPGQVRRVESAEWLTGSAAGLQPDNGRCIPASSVYPAGRAERRHHERHLRANPDGSINQAAFNRPLGQAGQQPDATTPIRRISTG